MDFSWITILIIIGVVRSVLSSKEKRQKFITYQSTLRATPPVYEAPEPAEDEGFAHAVFEQTMSQADRTGEWPNEGSIPWAGEATVHTGVDAFPMDDYAQAHAYGENSLCDEDPAHDFSHEGSDNAYQVSYERPADLDVKKVQQDNRLVINDWQQAFVVSEILGRPGGKSRRRF